MFLQVFHVGIPFEEPQQFVDDGFQVEFFGCDEREAVFQVEAHLVTEHAEGACAGTVVFAYAFRTDAVQQVKILFHDWIFLFLQR